MAFVTRSGSQLQLNGSPFRFSGCNIYWLGLESSSAYPSQFQVNDALSTAKEMGASVVRSLTLGISVGNSLSVWPSLNTTNVTAFNAIDYAIYKAGQLGLKLIIPLVDNWHFYHGGKHTFTDWESISDETLFYTNSQVITDFEAYISVILNRVNQYNHLAYKNDPTIMAWQLGNELINPFPPPSWSSAISAYIKSIDSNHLVMDGACASTGMNTASSNLTISTIDIYDDHYYPTLDTTLSSDASAVSAQNKAFVVGEFDWTQLTSGAGNAHVSLDATTVPSGGGSQSCKLTVDHQTSKYFYIQIFQPNLSIIAGHTYALSFWAKTLAPFQMQVALQSLLSPSFTVWEQVGFNLTTSWAQYTFTNYVATTSDSLTAVVFNHGNAATTTWFDLVSLVDTASPGVNLLSNPSFENSTIPPWVLNTPSVPHDDLSSFLPAVEANANVSGDLFWDLMPHNDVDGFFINPEVYSLYYPAQTSDQQTRAQLLRTHAYKMQGIIPAPTASLVVAPIITNISTSANVNTVAWQGVIGGAKYNIERSTTSEFGPFSVVGAALTDMQAPFVDSATVGGAWYRVRAYNINGVAGPYSSVRGSSNLVASTLFPATSRRTGIFPTISRRTGAFPNAARRGFGR